MTTRRTILQGLAAGAALVMGAGRLQAAEQSPFASLTPMLAGVKAITVTERAARVAKAQGLMAEQGIDALIIEPGSALVYFTGVHWGRSERLTAAIIPARGEIAYVTPHFEEPRLRAGMTLGDDVRAWHEHEDPLLKVAAILSDRGLDAGRIALEETVRYFVADKLKAALPAVEIISGNPVTVPCRVIKSAAEIALMQRASDITMAAYRAIQPHLVAGMSHTRVATIMHEAQVALGGRGVWSMALIGAASAYPHGTDDPQILERGEVLLMDCGCAVEGYQSDISRTLVFGKPSARQREIWDLVHEGQALAFETAQNGTPAGAVDDAVRALYEARGFGPDYRTPGLPHRTGHGIGMDGHEHINFVHGEATKLAPGMCLSNEPGIYIYGAFGIRLEDCLYMTATGPTWFSEPSPSLDDPFGPAR